MLFETWGILMGRTVVETACVALWVTQELSSMVLRRQAMVQVDESAVHYQAHPKNQSNFPIRQAMLQVSQH